MSSGSLRWLVDRHSAHHKPNPEDFSDRRDLPEYDRANDGRASGQKRQHQRESRARQSGHHQLIAHIGNHRRTDPDPNPCQDEQGTRKCVCGLHNSDGKYYDERGRHCCAEAFDSGRSPRIGNAMTQHDVEHTEGAIERCSQEAGHVAGPTNSN